MALTHVTFLSRPLATLLESDWLAGHRCAKARHRTYATNSTKCEAKPCGITWSRAAQPGLVEQQPYHNHMAHKLCVPAPGQPPTEAYSSTQLGCAVGKPKPLYGESEDAANSTPSIMALARRDLSGKRAHATSEVSTSPCSRPHSSHAHTTLSVQRRGCGTPADGRCVQWYLLPPPTRRRRLQPRS